MKKSVISAFLMVMFMALFFSTDVNALRGNVRTIDEINFPDDAFRGYVEEKLDENSDGMLTEEEISKVTSINVKEAGIKELTGIKYFTSLKELDCCHNTIKSLDLSGLTSLEKVVCHHNKLTSLNLTGCTGLKVLYCDHNELNTLDVSAFTNLTNLGCASNGLTTLDVTALTKLKALYCEDNSLTNLDLSKCPDLQKLTCENNKITTLDLRANKKLCDNLGNTELVSYDSFVTVLKYGEATQPVVAPSHLEVPNWVAKNGNIVAVDKKGKTIKYTGVVTWRGYNLLIANGVLYKKATFFQDKVDGKWKYFQNGILAKTGNTFIYAYGKLLHVNNGVLDTTDGFVRYNGKFVYSYHGMAATSYTGWVKYDKYKCYLVKGALTKITR